MRTCTVPGCTRPHYAKGLCKSDWARARYEEARPRQVTVTMDEETFRALATATARSGMTMTEEARCRLRNSLARELDAGGANHG